MALYRLTPYWNSWGDRLHIEADSRLMTTVLRASVRADDCIAGPDSVDWDRMANPISLP